MIRIVAEGVTYLFFTQDDGLPQQNSTEWNIANYQLVLPGISLWDSVIAKSLHDARLVLMQPLILLKTNDLNLYFLHWDDGRNLNELDKRIENGNYTDADFKYSVKTEFARTKCFSCSWEGFTLVVPTGDPYSEVPGLDMEKFNLRYERGGFKVCPKCGTPFRISVVKIFSELDKI